jgi:hypothetical protein
MDLGGSAALVLGRGGRLAHGARWEPHPRGRTLSIQGLRLLGIEASGVQSVAGIRTLVVLGLSSGVVLG